MIQNQLSEREKEVVRLLLQGKSNKLIALSLGISVRTVEFHLKNIYAKFQVNSRIELILKLGHAAHLPRTHTAPVLLRGVPGSAGEEHEENQDFYFQRS